MKTEQIVYAQGVKGRKGDVILRLSNGKIVLPRGFTPREGEWYLIEVLEDRGRYAIATLHQHVVGVTGICITCGRVADKERLEQFVRQWWENMIRSKQRLREIGEIKGFLTSRFGDLIVELGDMIYRLEREKEKYTVGEYICPPGYGVIDSCFSYTCRGERCEQLEYLIKYFRHLRDVELERRFERVKQIVEPDAIMTVDNLGIRMVNLI
jgi:hypothetical protein